MDFVFLLQFFSPAITMYHYWTKKCNRQRWTRWPNFFFVRLSGEQLRKKYTHTLCSRRIFDAINDNNKVHFVNIINSSKIDKKSQQQNCWNKILYKLFLLKDKYPITNGKRLIVTTLHSIFLWQHSKKMKKNSMSI